MLTTLEANFVQEYKTNGNATEALKSAGYKYSSLASARIKACRLLKKPEIIETLVNHQTKLVKQIETPNVTIIPQKTITLPTREEYASKALERSSDESKLKEDTKYKYYDLAGRVLNHVRNDNDNKMEGNILNVICNDLNLTLTSPSPDFTSPDVIPTITPPSITPPSEESAHE